MDPRRLAAVGYAALMCGVAVFQLAAVIGAPVAAYTQGGGSSGALPPGQRAVAAVSMIVLLVCAAAVLGRLGLGPLRRSSDRWLLPLAWIATVYGVVAVFLNLVTRSAAERNLWAPYSIAALAMLAACRAVGTRVRVQ